MRLILFLIAGLCSAQTQQFINSGGDANGMYVPDQGFIGGGVYGPANQADAGWKAQTGIYSTLRYGASFSYDLLEVNGTCGVQLSMIENRPAVASAGIAAAAIGARVFTVTANGVTTPPLDIFAAVGAQLPYSPAPIMTQVVDGHLRIKFVASAGNAVVSGIQVSCTSTQPVYRNAILTCVQPPAQVPALNPDGTPKLNPDGTPVMITANCAGMYYVDMITPAGTELKILGGIAPVGFTLPAAGWSLVP